MTTAKHALLFTGLVSLAGCSSDRSMTLARSDHGARLRLAERVEGSDPRAGGLVGTTPSTPVTGEEREDQLAGEQLRTRTELRGPEEAVAPRDAVGERTDPVSIWVSASISDVDLSTARRITGPASPVYDTPATAPDGGGTNTWAIVGFVCSFFIPILGIIFCAIGLGQIKRTGERGHGLAIAGIVISVVTILLFLALAA